MGGIIMNENIDLTKILEGCPYGTSFYNSVYGAVIFVGITSDFYHPILLESYNPNSALRETICITKYGREKFDYDGECTLFPSKNQRDWSKFKRFWDKPKDERFDVNTLKPFDKVLSRNPYNKLWSPNLFGYLLFDEVRCVDGNWYCVIPYNEDTKHLVGTKNDCPEYYKWWEK